MMFNHKIQVTALLIIILLVNLATYFSIPPASQPTITEVPPLKPFPESSAKQEPATEAPRPPPNSDPIYSDAAKKLRKEALLNVEANRQGILKTLNNETRITEFYKAVKMEAYCEKNERIGGSGDGGKQVCNAKAVRKDGCTLLSLGLHNQIDYDRAIYDATGRHCKILGADKDPQNSRTQKSYETMGGQIFVGTIPNELTIPDMLLKAGRREVELLKIDIEGSETIALEPLIKDFYVCQIMIELHGQTALEHLDMLRMMARYGFRLYNIEPNPFCEKCCEYSLINELCMAQFGVVPLGINIPH
uniref:Methyltransf_21 domain-containing protein n=1 Tax=Caenorhabditis tropicalis TaxID=1561998 RepID=A0A1I7SXP0_9PELO